MAKSVTRNSGLEFKGKKSERELAELSFGLFQARGAFFAAEAPITMAVASIVEALTAMGTKATQKSVENALDANDHIFNRNDDDELTFVTTKEGSPPTLAGGASDTHDLSARFATPEPERERVLPRATIDDPVSDSIVSESSTAMEFPPDSWQAAVAAALREAGEDSPEVVLGEAEIESLDDEVTAESADLAEEDVVVDEEPAETDQPEAVEPEPELASPPEPVEPFVPEPVTEVDMGSVSDDQLVDAIELAMSDEPNAIRWGDYWMHKNNVPSLTKDDLNKIQETLGAASEPVSDYALVGEIRPDQSPGSDQFEIERFALNHGMAQELGTFEFVGTGRQSIWTAAGRPSITTELRTSAEIGHDYRFLADYRTPDAELEPGLVEHVLTFYEHRYGVLPLNANIATILPKAAFNDQRSTRLTFESPQTFETFEVDLRYPTSNRGGFLIGFGEFFTENLVPGAVLTIEATRDQETHFIIEYFQISRQDRKLLHFNDRRNAFVFQSTTYFCATQDDMLIDDNHFERLSNVEPLSDEDRRHVDKVVRATFERVGIRTDADDEVTYRAHIVDILAAANIERPISEPYLRDVLLGGAFPEFVADDSEEDVFLYVAAST